MLNNVAIYVRYSSLDVLSNDKSRSIENQIKILSQFASTLNLNIYNIYSDYHISGKNYNRPAFQKLLNDIECQKINTILVKDFSRLGRNFIETSAYLLDYFPKYNIRFISFDDHYDSLNQELSSSLIMKNLINEYYLKDISKKIRSSLALKGENETLVTRKYGYIKINNKFIIDQVASKTIILIYNLRINGYSISKIQEELFNQKIITPYFYYHKLKNIPYKKYSNEENIYKWDYQTILSILKDRFYLGESINFKSTYKITSTIKRDYIILNDHPAIIDNKKFDMVSKLQFQKEKRKQSLSNNIYCYTCLKNGQNGKYKLLYYNNEYFYKCNICKNLINENILKDKFVILIKKLKLELISNPYKYINENKKEKCLSNDMLKNYHYQIKSIEYDIKLTFENYVNKIISEDEYIVKLKELNQILLAKKNELLYLENDKIIEDEISSKYYKFINRTEFYEDNITTFLKKNIEYILYDKEKENYRFILTIDKELNNKNYNLKDSLLKEYQKNSLKDEIINILNKSNCALRIIEMYNILNNKYSYNSIKKTIYKLQKENKISKLNNSSLYSIKYLESKEEKQIIEIIKNSSKKLCINEIAKYTNNSWERTRVIINNLINKNILDEKDIIKKKNLKTIDEELVSLLNNNPTISKQELANIFNTSLKTIYTKTKRLGYKLVYVNKKYIWEEQNRNKFR